MESLMKSLTLVVAEFIYVTSDVKFIEPVLLCILISLLESIFKLYEYPQHSP